jgi:hypothetical protein
MKEQIEKNKVPLIVGTLVLVAVLIYFYQNKLASFFLYGGAASNSNAVNTGAVSNTGSNSSNSSNSAVTITNDTVLKKGDRGDKVGDLQVLLNKGLVKSNVGYATLGIDNAFGSKTEGALYLLVGKKQISINEFKKLLN